MVLLRGDEWQGAYPCDLGVISISGIALLSIFIWLIHRFDLCRLGIIRRATFLVSCLPNTASKHNIRAHSPSFAFTFDLHTFEICLTKSEHLSGKFTSYREAQLGKRPGRAARALPHREHG